MDDLLGYAGGLRPGLIPALKVLQLMRGVSMGRTTVHFSALYEHYIFYSGQQQPGKA